MDINADNHIDMIITLQNTKTDSYTIDIHLMDHVNEIFKLAYTIENSGIFVGDFDGDKL